MNSPVAQLRTYLVTQWQAVLAYTAMFLIIGTVLLVALGSLLPGFSLGEQASYLAGRSLQAIWQDPINAPYDFLVYLMRYVTPDNIVATRLVSVLLGWGTIIIFCLLLYRWFGTRTAIMGTILFGTSSWFLHVSRLGTPEVVVFGFFALVACGVWLRESRNGIVTLLAILIAAALLYTPGMIWFLLIGLLWQLSVIDKIFKQHLGWVTLGALLFIAILLPLAWHFYQHPSAIMDWLCLPDNWNPLHLLGNIVQVPMSIFFRQPEANPVLWLGRLPVLSVFASCMFFLGAFVFWKYARLRRSAFLAFVGIAGAIIIGLSDNQIGLTILVPFVYMVAAVGLGYLIDSWQAIFPRNPIAKVMGMTMVVIVLILACTYNLRSYFIAWPEATATRAVFPIKKP